MHRLDKDTSGVLIAAKTTQAKEFLAEQFRSRSLSKRYLAVVKGTPREAEGTVSGPIGRDPGNRKRFAITGANGKPAETRYRLLRDYGGYSFLALQPETGRTHQLRVHLVSLGCPVLGDPIYARLDTRFPDATLMLHAASLAICIPGREDPVTFRAPLPKRMRDLLRFLGSGARFG